MLIVEKYLKDLVENNRRVIIPTLGAFLLKEGEHGGRTVIFSSFLKFNDGFLETEIVERTGLTKEKASAAVKKFITTVERSLSSKNSYDIEGFGYFTTDSKGAISFIPTSPSLQQVNKPVAIKSGDKDDIILEQEPIVINNDNNIEPTPVIANDQPIGETEELTEKKLKEKAKKTTVKDDDTTAVSSEKNDNEEQNIQANLVTVIPVNYPLNFDGNNNSDAEDDSNSAKSSSIFADEFRAKRKKRKKRWLIAAFASLILIVCGVFAFCHIDHNKLNVSVISFWNKQQKTEFNTADLPQLIENKEGVTPDSSKILISPTSISNDALRYHIVAGCFSEQINAERFAQRCLEQGFHAETLSRIGDLYPVSINKSSNYEEAVTMRNNYNTSHSDKAWIYRTY